MSLLGKQEAERKRLEAEMIRAMPEHFYMDGEQMRVRFDQLFVRREEDHPGQLTVVLRHKGKPVVTMYVPDRLHEGVMVQGITGSTGMMIEVDHG